MGSERLNTGKKRLSHRSWWKVLRHRLEYSSYRALMALVPAMPRSWLVALARLAGRAGPWLIFWEARKARVNLDLVYGETLSKAGKRRVLRESFENVALTALYFFWSKNLMPENIQDVVEVPQASREVLQRLKEGQRGAVALLAHYGNWELMGVATALLGAPRLNVIVRPLKNPLLDEPVNRYRCRTGNRVIERSGAMMKARQALRRGELVALVFDQNVDPEQGGTFAPFLGLPAATTKAAAILALKTGAPLVPATCEPLPGGRYRLRFDPPVDYQEEGDFERDVQWLTERCNRHLEEIIRERPGPWLWMYKRWRIRPTLEQGPYPDYSKPERRLRRKAAGAS